MSLSGVHGKAVMTRPRVPGGAEHNCGDEREDSSVSLEKVARGVRSQGRRRALFPWLEAWRSNETGPGGLFSFGGELTVSARRVLRIRRCAPHGFFAVRLWNWRPRTGNVVRGRQRDR